MVGTCSLPESLRAATEDGVVAESKLDGKTLRAFSIPIDRIFQKNLVVAMSNTRENEFLSI